jgi:hypothetical protein
MAKHRGADTRVCRVEIRLDAFGFSEVHLDACEVPTL